MRIPQTPCRWRHAVRSLFARYPVLGRKQGVNCQKCTQLHQKQELRRDVGIILYIFFMFFCPSHSCSCAADGCLQLQLLRRGHFFHVF